MRATDQTLTSGFHTHVNMPAHTHTREYIHMYKKYKTHKYIH